MVQTLTCLDETMVPNNKINFDNTVLEVSHPDSD